MTRKGQESGNCRGDNTVCGFGARLRRLTAGVCLITQTIFPVMAAAPTHIKDNTHQSVSTPSTQPNVRTTPYMLGALESPQTVAARFGITVDELRRLNQFRTLLAALIMFVRAMSWTFRSWRTIWQAAISKKCRRNVTVRIHNCRLLKWRNEAGRYFLRR